MYIVVKLCRDFFRMIIFEEQGSILLLLHILWGLVRLLCDVLWTTVPRSVKEIKLLRSTQTSPVWVVMLITAPFLLLGVTQMTEMTVVG